MSAVDSAHTPEILARHLRDWLGFIAADEAEAGMAAMSEVYEETGRELYLGAGGRERD